MLRRNIWCFCIILCGITRSFVFGVIAASSSSAVRRNSFSAFSYQH